MVQEETPKSKWSRDGCSKCIKRRCEIFDSCEILVGEERVTEEMTKMNSGRRIESRSVRGGRGRERLCSQVQGAIRFQKTASYYTSKQNATRP
jgi:hypothetical protein